MIWDLPTRLFHWSFVICIIGAFLTGREGNLFWHEIFGLAALGLFIFRIIWGFVGHASARFANFVVGPRHIWQYLTDLRHRRDDPYPGHNPLGALSVLALLALMGTLGLTGLWTGDDILYEGPLTFLAPNWAGVAGRWHILLQQLILPLVGLHLAALLAHHFFFEGTSGPAHDHRRQRRHGRKADAHTPRPRAFGNLRRRRPFAGDPHAELLIIF